MTANIRRTAIVLAAAGLAVGCGKSSPTAPSVNSEEHAEWVAWAVKSAIQHAAPDDATATWTGTTVNGYSGGTAVVTGSFTYDYDALSGIKHETYTDVVIQLTDYCDDAEFYPKLTGFIHLSGTCTTTYGWSTTYSGQWEAVGGNLQLSGRLKGTVSIAMALREGGLEWAAYVESAAGNWTVGSGY